MKLSISHIAWPWAEEAQFLDRIRRFGCSGVEVAPSRIWEEPVSSSKQDRQKYKDMVSRSGLEISAMHALLYHRPDLGLFRETSVTLRTVDYLKQLIELAADLGAEVLVFGSPGNRKRGEIPFKEACEQAAEFFFPVGEAAKDLGVFFCVEPLRVEETDFITTAEQGLQLVNMVGSKGFALHLDAKAVAAQRTDGFANFKDNLDVLKHFHINDPGLVEVNSTGQVDHQDLGHSLRQIMYNRYVSIEMRLMPDYENAVSRSIEEALKAYVRF